MHIRIITHRLTALVLAAAAIVASPRLAALEIALPGTLAVHLEPIDPGVVWALAWERDADGRWVEPAGGVLASGESLDGLAPGHYAIFVYANAAWRTPDPIEVHVAPGADVTRSIALSPSNVYPTIDEIPDQEVRHGDTLTFVIGESASMTVEPHAEAERAVDLEGGTHFSYRPSTEEREQFRVVFRAGGRERTVIITPLASLEGEHRVIRFQGEISLASGAESKTYLSLTDELSSGNVVFNHESQRVRTVRVAGARLVIQKGHENGLYERLAYDAEHRDNDNVASIELIAEEVVLRNRFHLPAANVTIIARRLAFEDPSEISLLDVTPIKKSGTAATGARGIDAGTMLLRVAEIDAPGDGARFAVAGGDGQEAAPGANGAGLSPAPRTFSTYARNSNAPAFPNGWNGKVTYLKVSEVCIITVTRREDGTTTCPRSGNNARANGTPGQGGSGGLVRAPFDLRAFTDLRSGRPGATQPTRFGSAGDQPYGAIKATTWFNCLGEWASWSGTACNNGPGTNHPAVAAPGPAPAVGRTAVDVPADAWIHPLWLRASLRYARDVYMNGYPEETRRLLAPIATALESVVPAPEDAASVAQIASEITGLLERIRNNLDYFGYPAGWVPMLSFEVNFELFKREVAAAGDIIYLAHYLSLESSQAVNKAAAIERASAELSAEFDRLQADLASARGRIGDALFQAETIDRSIRELGRAIQAREDSLRDEAKLTLGLKKALRIAGAVLPLIPVYQPALGLAGSALTAASKFNEQDALTTAIDGTNLAQEFLSSNMDSLLEDYASETPQGDVDADQAALDKRAAALASFNAALVGVNQTLAEVQSWDSDLDREIKILAAQDDEHQDLVKQVRDLNARKRRFAEEIGILTQLAKRLMDGLDENSLAFKSLKTVLSDVQRKIHLEAASYMSDMGQRARHRLLTYQYYLIKAYQYRAVRPYHEVDARAFQIAAIFDHFATNFTNTFSPDASDAILNPDVSPNLTDIYTNQLREVTSAMVNKLNEEPPEQTDTILVELDAAQLAKLNSWDDTFGENPDGDLRIDLVGLGGLFDQKQENLRIFDLSVAEFRAQPRAGSRAARVTLHIEHSGESLISSKGETYRFHHYRTLETPPIAWRSRYDPVQDTHSRPELSKAANSLLESLLGGDAGDLLLYSRPSAWADLVVSKETLSDVDEMEITRLVLSLRFDFSEKQRRQADVEIVASTAGGSELAPRMLVRTTDANARADGNGSVRRVYRSGQSVRFEAPVTHGTYSFERWVNRRGDTVSEEPVLDVALPLSDPATVTRFRAIYSTEGGEPGGDGPVFSRGDVNDDTRTDLSDAVATLNFLFLAGAAPGCMKAADVNDDGGIDLSDSIRLLNHLFAGGAPPPAPFRACGRETTTDFLDCRIAAACAR